MPFAGFKDWDACVSEVKRKNPSYSGEVVDKVCGKLKSKLEKCNNTEAAHKAILESLKQFSNSQPSPSKEDLKEVEPYPIHKAWEFNPDDILASPRKVSGTFHVPKVDKDREIITKSAMEKAIPNYMHLPILHDYHKERVLGLVTKVWEEADAFHFEALFKATPDVNDAWEKAKRGVYDHVSIYGARLSGSPSCGLNPSQRAEPCISEAIRLDSISACDEGARNDHTSMEVVKADYNNENIERFLIDGDDIFIKTSSTSVDSLVKASTMGEGGLMHGTYDGVKDCGCKVKKMRVREVDEKEEDEDMEKGYKDENLSNMGKQQRERREHAEKVFGSKQEPGKWEKYEKAEEDYMEKAEGVEGMFKEILSTLKRLVSSDKKVHTEMEKAGEMEGKPDVKKEDKTSKQWEDEEKKEGMESKKVEEAEAKTKRFHKKGKKEVEKGMMTKINSGGTAESAQSAYDSHTSDLKPYNHKTGTWEGANSNKRFEKGERPKVTEEPIEPKNVGTSQPVDKRVSEVGKGSTNWNVSPKTKQHTHKVRMSAEETKFGVAQRTKERAEQRVQKADTMTDEVEVKEEIVKAEVKEVSDEQFVEEIVKANLNKTDEIMKAQMKTMVDEITKAFEAKFETLEKELKEIKEQPLVKAAVLIPEDGKVNGVALNYEAIEKFMKR